MMSNLRGINDIGRFVESHDTFNVICHVSPDGDTLGSGLALSRILRTIGKTARTYCDGDVPQVYRFLPDSDSVLKSAYATPADAAIAVDCADIGRMGRCKAVFDMSADTLEIDHHGTNDGYANIDYIDGDSAATGVLIWRIANQLNWPIDDGAALCLYVALITDTGGFSYRNADSGAFLAAAEMLAAHSIDVASVNNLVYRTVPYAKTKLLGRAIEKAGLFMDGRIAVTSLTMADRREFGGTGGDFDGIVEALRDIDSVNIAIFIRETDEGQKVSMRSTDSWDVSGICAEFGGGGHINAAGFTSQLSIDELASTMTELARKVLENA